MVQGLLEGKARSARRVVVWWTLLLDTVYGHLGMNKWDARVGVSWERPAIT